MCKETLAGWRYAQAASTNTQAPVYAVPAYPVYVERPVYYQHVYPTVIYYAHGRYELRGDGIQTPYQWVWIPNPPPPPPPPAAPPAPPSSPTR